MPFDSRAAAGEGASAAAVIEVSVNHRARVEDVGNRRMGVTTESRGTGDAGGICVRHLPVPAQASYQVEAESIFHGCGFIWC